MQLLISIYSGFVFIIFNSIYTSFNCHVCFFSANHVFILCFGNFMWSYMRGKFNSVEERTAACKCVKGDQLTHCKTRTKMHPWVTKWWMCIVSFRENNILLLLPSQVFFLSRFCMFKLINKKKKGVVECPLCKTEVTKRWGNHLCKGAGGWGVWTLRKDYQ